MPKNKNTPKTKDIKVDLKNARECFKEKFKTDVNSECIHCINAALSEEGYISDEEVRSIYDPWKEKKNKKHFLSMVNPK